MDTSNKKDFYQGDNHLPQQSSNSPYPKELIALITQEGFLLDWQETKDLIDSRQMLLQQKFYDEYHADANRAHFYFGFTDASVSLHDTTRYLHVLAARFIKLLSNLPDIEFLREKVMVTLEPQDAAQLLQSAPFLNGQEYLDLNWLKLLWAKLNAVFAKEIKGYAGSVAEFFIAQNPHIHTVGRIFFHLVENKQGDFPFAFLATYAASVGSDGKSKHLPLKNALIEYRGNQKKLLTLLSTVNKASENSTFVLDLVESGEIFHPLNLSSSEAYTFLKEIPIYEAAGILCRMPNWWKSKSNALRLSVNIGNKTPSRVGMEALIDFDAQISLGDEKLTAAELKKLLAESEGLAFIKGKWVEVNHEKLQETLLAYEEAQRLAGKSDMNLMEAMRFQMKAANALNVSEKSYDLEVTNGEWLKTVVAKLTQPEKIEAISCGEDFHATLRPYQQKGLSWLHFMKMLGLGACLADDMGLGKTVQIIALLNYMKTQRDDKTLLVIPASLIGNWMDELRRFAPSLQYMVLHPSENKALIPDTFEPPDNCDLFITTYGMLVKYTRLQEIQWNTLVLDEAQAIKNPGTKQTKLVKQMKADYRIAMTGTPVENRLSDLWSLFDFLNKGLLGSPKEFTVFTQKLKTEQADYSRLRSVVSPFILRRLKTDKSVISDLPDKIEMKTYAALNKKQAALYNALVNDLKTKLETSGEGIERKGLILASIMKFKQICNHPDQYLGQQVYAENESGKYERLREICETIYEKRERVLVFTQFKEITERLSEFLATVFQHKGLVLHGETPVSKRRELVAQFQGADYVPFLVLSIKAGGVGLNLTAANHVIHFDRWWNPAVENQATDRAFRIGQKKNVVVHKFITKGTIEEKIDRMIEDKIQLSNELVPDGQENWVTEMDNKQLMDMFRLTT